MKNAKELTHFLLQKGASEVGFCHVDCIALANTPIANEIGIHGLDYAVTIAVHLSSNVVDGITDKPTFAYFHHYRTVNTAIDNILLSAGLFLEGMGYRYFPVAASQSVTEFSGLFPHKTAAVLCGLGVIGKNALFISGRYGPRVRLGTLFTDMPLPISPPQQQEGCRDCRICICACPAMALTGDPAHPVDPAACSRYMKEHFSGIGRGVVCGICMKCCPKGK